jgi:hypothetical protein
MSSSKVPLSCLRDRKEHVPQSHNSTEKPCAIIKAAAIMRGLFACYNDKNC